MMPSVTKPATTVGRYAIFDEIASGGMAAVHLARLVGPVGFSRTVAVKRLFPQLARDPDFSTMLVDEARMSSRVRHPNVVPILDVVAEHDDLLLVMEYVPGASLSWLLHEARLRGRRADPTVVVAIMAGVLRGLHAAHTATNEQGAPLDLVHRDVSPENILVGADGLARLLDFGIAKAAGRLHTTRGVSWKGKPAYMAPEQLRDGDVSARTDVYAASVVLWEALTGHKLFHADNDYAVSVKVFEKVVDPPRRLVRDLPSSLDEVTLRGLSRDPEERFSSALDMARALEDAVRPSTLDDVRRWVEELAQDVLGQRAEVVAAIERAEVGELREGPGDAAPPADDASRASTPVVHRDSMARRSRWKWTIAGLLIALGGLAVRAAWQGNAVEEPLADTPARAAPSSLHPLPHPPDMDDGQDEEEPGPVASVDARATAPAPPRATSTATPSARKPPAPSGGATRRCDPPYVIDAEGFHRIKPECLE